MKTTNRLLDSLPEGVLDRLAPYLEHVHIARNHVVHHPGEEITFLYFPTTCMISITITTLNGSTIEAGAVGSREVAGINAFMGGSETTQTEYVGQLAGDALRIAAAPMKVEFDRNTEFRGVMLKYTQALLAQISQNVACNRLHQLDQRCARWLLEVRDRVGTDRFVLTQDFIAEMLGVSRVTVSQAMSELKQGRVIDYSRGQVSLRDLPALEARSCECYSALQREYDRLLGALEVGA
jgi:CRP-like cAMP-binding protein